MVDKIQFILQQRIANQEGKIFMDKKHYPLYWSSINFVPHLSPIIDYTLICAEQKTYTLSANQEVYFLVLQEV